MRADRFWWPVSDENGKAPTAEEVAGPLQVLAGGLAGLTAWGLHRYGELRGTIVLPPLSDPTYTEVLARAQAELTTSALAETFVAAAVVAGVGLIVGLGMRSMRDAEG